MSEFATALKAGTTTLVLALIESGWRVPMRLRNPVQAIKDISRDQSYKWLVEVQDKGLMPAVDVQRLYLAAAKERLAGRGADTDWTLRTWEQTLDALERDPHSLSDRLDWVAKRSLLTEYVESENVGWDDEALPSYDLAYCNVDPDESLYYALEQAGEMVRLTDDAAIETACTQAPVNTRAAIRGLLVDRFPEQIGSAGWNRVILREGDESWAADLDDYLTPQAVAEALAQLAAAPTLTDVLREFRRKQGK
jgi:hypothetical protein